MKNISVLITIAMLFGTSLPALSCLASERTSGLKKVLKETDRHLPRSFQFTYNWRGQSHSTANAVFVDFLESDSLIKIDLNQRKVTQETKIRLRQPSAGNIAFDIVSLQATALIDGKATPILEFETPGLETKLRAIETPTEIGEHELVIRSELTTGVFFDEAGFSLRFSMNDSEDRSFLEKYLPTNLEYDTYAMKFDFEIVGGTLDDLEWYANGDWNRQSGTRMTLQFPDYFNCSSPFIRLYFKGSTLSAQGAFTTQSGRLVPIQIFKLKTQSSTDLSRFLEKAKQTLSDLEMRYGEWAHPSLLIQAYGEMTDTGGMEYVGAAATAFQGLDHELFHSYFGRGAMPANGNAGWIDEAVATWRDHGYRLADQPIFEISDLGAIGLYSRATNARAYEDGGSFIEYLAKLFDIKGKSLDSTLAQFFAHYLKRTYSTDDFQGELESIYGETLQPQFEQYVYGRIPR